MRTTKPGRQRMAAALGRLGGRANTDAQNDARRQNAQRAGRPRRICIHCGEPVAGGHVDRRLDVSCGAHGWRWQQRHADPPAEASVLVTLTRSQAAALLDGEPEPDRLAATKVLRAALRRR